MNAEANTRAGVTPEAGTPQPSEPLPWVFWFDPTCDRRAGLGRSYTPPRRVLDLTADLGSLPQFLAGSGDVVVVRQRPSEGFLKRLAAAGFPIPEFAEMGKGGELPPDLLGRPLGRLRPWGWSPVAVAWAAPLFQQLPHDATQRPETVWNEAVRSLYSKAWSAGFLGRFLTRVSEVHPKWAPLLCDLADVGVVCTSVGEVEGVAERIRADRGRGALAKVPFGASGRDQVRLAPAPAPLWDHDAHRRHVERLLREQGLLVVEPYLDRLADPSVQLEIIAPGQARTIGLSRFFTDRRGQYQGSVLHPLEAGLEGEARQLLWGEEGLLEPVAAFLAEQLAAELAPTGYRGPLGIDLLVYRDGDRVRLKPVVEINPRCTMGHVALELGGRVAAGAASRWLMLRVPQIREAGFASPLALARHLEERYPVMMSGGIPPGGGGRIAAGVLCTNDPGVAHGVLSLLCVEGEDRIEDPVFPLDWPRT